MDKEAFQNSDGDLLLVPECNALKIQTEHGWLLVQPKEIAVIPRGIKFKVYLNNTDTHARGYLLEVFEGHFELPELGPIGANGLANPRDFLYPTAAFDDDPHAPHLLINKYMNQYWTTSLSHSPFDVVAWHGNYAPYKYPLTQFCPVNAVAFDHLDPSIFTVLTCKSTVPGVAVADFVIFPPRWLVAENTFRPPYFHRNTMSEFMGLISGTYEAKKEGFQPGGASLHSICTAHGPDAATYQSHSQQSTDVPTKLPSESMAFMFESCYPFQITQSALTSPWLQSDYWKHWQGLRSHFQKKIQ
ncbi:hypothetical protein HMI56_006524 [Coelomomyces lativittatus]|nr:hypothetical protein HMI56_006524 [Coelomomyces lativittatus]